MIYVSKLALAIKTMQNTSFMSLMEAMTPMVAADPTMMRFIDAKRTIQGLSRNFGVPQEWLATEEEIMESEQAMAAQQEQQDMMMAAEGLGKLGPDMGGKVANAVAGGQ